MDDVKEYEGKDLEVSLLEINPEKNVLSSPGETSCVKNVLPETLPIRKKEPP